MSRMLFVNLSSLRQENTLLQVHGRGLQQSPTVRERNCLKDKNSKDMLEKIYKNRSPHKRKPILDACCGSRAMWFDRTNPLVDFMDIRSVEYELSTGQLLIVNPDIVGDFTNMPFRDESYKLVVWDPPHLLRAGKNWDITKKIRIIK